MRIGYWRLVGALLGIIAQSALAGPPYQTDDPEPTALHKWEIYNFVDLDGRANDFAGEAGVDLNYGAAKGLQLTVTLPMAFSHSPAEGWKTGTGEVELAAKYRFIDDEKSGWQGAVFPRLILPTASHGLGGSRTRLLLPLWVQKDFGKTSIFGGGGFEINPGPGNRNFWQTGVVVTHDFTDGLQLGAELNWESADTRGGRSRTAVDLGLIQKLGGPFQFLAAGGPSFSAGKTGYHGYAALELNF